MPKKANVSVEMNILEINRQTITFYILGQTPFIYNAMSSKGLGSILLGSKRKTAAEKATQVKHNPPDEYRESVYCRRADEQGPTRLIIPAHLFKASIREVALRMPGATKSEINQLVSVEGISVDMYGTPQVIMNVMRSADINRTPDVRTRAVVPQWACKVEFNYVTPILSAQTISQLMAAAGQIMGVGDSRPQKGYNFGKFTLVSEDDKEWNRIVKGSNMARQDQALQTPVLFDRETERLWGMWQADQRTRDKPQDTAGKAVPSKAKRGNGSAHADA